MSKFFMSNRRQFIRAASGYVLAIPFLPSLARGQAGGGMPSRFVSMRTVYGQPPQLFYPGSRPSTALAANVYHRTIAPGQTLSPILNSAFASISHKLSILRGIDHSSDGHNDTHMLSPGGSSEGDGSSWPNSFDEVLARSSVVYPTVPQHRVLRIHPNTSRYSPWGGYSYWNGQQLPYDTDMASLHAKLFGGFAPPVAGGVDKTQRKMKVIDLAKDAFDSLSRERNISTADIANVNQYKDMLNDLGNKVNNLSTLSCTPPGSVDATGSFEKAYNVGVDMTILAMTCGLTQVVTFAMPWFGASPGQNRSAFHGISHWTYKADQLVPDMGHGAERNIYSNTSAGAIRDTQYYSWTAEKVARIMTKMDAITETNGKTMLDNSLVYWGNEQGGSAAHDRFGLPTVIAGTLNGKVKPGYWDFTKRPFTYYANRLDNRNAAGTVTQATLLTTLANLYGLPPASYEKAGQGGFGDFKVSSIVYGFSKGESASQLYGNYTADTASQRKVLPGWLV